jgi:hypothetical protein
MVVADDLIGDGDIALRCFPLCAIAAACGCSRARQRLDASGEIKASGDETAF